jgi:uncharacterized protein (TIGR02145 family)
MRNKLKPIAAFYPLFLLTMTFSFKIEGQTVTDADGNIYSTITIGGQTWMAENLKTTKYNDGSPIQMITSEDKWQQYDNPGYCWFNNEEKNYKDKYGALYNWYAVNTKKLCPQGWHVPDTTDLWNTLFAYLSKNKYGYNGEPVKIAKSMASQSGWTQDSTKGNPGNDQNNNNGSGFNGIPAGARSMKGVFDFDGGFATWWSSSEFDGYLAAGWNIMYYDPRISPSWKSKRVGSSVRCLKDK